ncbi:LysR family transcriptional regulator [Symbioplanes lichenis]|uniref:LysR family transcriptional regulator n=1 Tax=Symbioplanes lichenis TaxID=1629072 RepID=UPI0027381AD3|nr:LysR family transcriptional regulator [Actinoplanes lichenis]
MDLWQLECFVAVAEEAGFTKAAGRLHLTQSGVSTQIRQIERDLGVRLFDRSSRSVRLTPAGQAALPYARSALAGAEAVRQAVAEVTGLVRGQLRVGMVTGCTVTALFEALASFHREFPTVDIALTEADSATLVARVRADEADIALVGGDPTGLTGHTVVGAGLTAAVPGGHALAEGPSVSLRRLCTYPLICPPPGIGVRGALDEACATAGLHPTVAMQVTAPEAIAALAARGLGVGVLHASAAAALPELTTVPVEDLPLPVTLVWRGETTLLRAFLPHCKEAFTRE